MKHAKSVVLPTDEDLISEFKRLGPHKLNIIRDGMRLEERPKEMTDAAMAEDRMNASGASGEISTTQMQVQDLRQPGKGRSPSIK